MAGNKILEKLFKHPNLKLLPCKRDRLPENRADGSLYIKTIESYRANGILERKEETSISFYFRDYSTQNGNGIVFFGDTQSLFVV